MKLEDLNSEKFSSLKNEKMSKIRGGNTLNTVTIYSSGGGSNDCSSDGDCLD